FPHMTAEANILYGLKGVSKAERKERVLKMLDLVGLADKRDRYPHQLSGGERQRLAIARAIAPMPKVILLDEPFSGLDTALRRSLRDDLRAILKEVGATAVMVTHHPEDALVVGDRIAVLKLGQIEQNGIPQDLYSSPKSVYCAELFGPINSFPSYGGDRFVRPHDVKLYSEPGKARIGAKVVNSFFIGGQWEVNARCEDGKKWTIHTKEKPSVAVGGRVWLAVS
ncbi:MAG: ABC transporter ATP-binding protein, partial [Verrucomicrobiota bacterium]